MKTLIIYASRHGCARRAAEKIGEALGDGVPSLSWINLSG